MYLLADSHDCVGASPALNTNSGPATGKVGRAGSRDGSTTATAELEGGFAADLGAALAAAARVKIEAGFTELAWFTVASGAAMGEVVDGEAAATARAAGVDAGVAVPATARGAPGFEALAPAAVDGLAFGKVAEAAASTEPCRDAVFGGTRSCPRHFFSSHSTQSARPAETGNPQASHLRRWRNTGGT